MVRFLPEHALLSCPDNPSPRPSPARGEGGDAEAQAVNFLTWRQNHDAFRCRPMWHRGEDEVRLVLAAR